MAMDKFIRVIACVVERDSHLLLCQRPLHKRHGGLWEFPGGKIDPGETPLAAAKRELREELALEVLEVGKLAHAMVDPGSHFRIEFVPAVVAGEPVCLEHAAIAWVTEAELLRLPLAPSDHAYACWRVSGGCAEGGPPTPP
jgi:8-oxo-dGTP diphosphatase